MNAQTKMNDAQLKEAIGRNIAVFRKARGYSVDDFSALLRAETGGTWIRQTISYLENGHRAYTITDLAAIARVLDVTLQDLAGDGHSLHWADPFYKPSVSVPSQDPEPAPQEARTQEVNASYYSEQMEAILTKPICTVKELSVLLGIGINQAYEAVREGKIKTVTIGKRILIPTRYVREFLGE